MRAGLALYVDPIIGTNDDPPSRYYVLYPPIWSAICALFPSAAAVVISRALSFGAFVAGLIALSRRAPASLLAVAFTLGFFPVTLFAASSRPDGLAVGLAAFGLARALRERRVDSVAAVLFAAAALVKPNVIGLASGAFLATLVTSPRAVVRPVFVGLCVGITGLAAFWFASSGQFFTHLLRSTGQPPSLVLWQSQLAQRLPFVAIPLASAAVFAWPLRRETEVRLALFALVTSTAWAIVSLAKIGSASNYWMEPALAAVALVTAAERAREETESEWGGPSRRVLAAMLFAQAWWNGVGAFRSATEQIPGAFAKRAALEAAAMRCLTEPGDVVIADEGGIQYDLNGRVVWTPYQVGHLFAQGKLPREPWLADLENPRIRCVIDQHAEFESAEPFSRERRQFDTEIWRAIKARFVRITGYAPPAIERQAGIWVYGRR
jgi:hypothetical protein